MDALFVTGGYANIMECRSHLRCRKIKESAKTKASCHVSAGCRYLFPTTSTYRHTWWKLPNCSIIIPLENIYFCQYIVVVITVSVCNSCSIFRLCVLCWWNRCNGAIMCILNKYMIVIFLLTDLWSKGLRIIINCLFVLSSVIHWSVLLFSISVCCLNTTFLTLMYCSWCWVVFSAWHSGVPAVLKF